MQKLLLVARALLVTWLALGWTSSSAFSADDPAGKKPAKSTSKLSGKELLKQWAELVARREKVMRAVSQIEDEYSAAKSVEEKQRVQAKFEKLRDEFQTEINPGLLQLAPQVHKQDTTDPIAAQILVGKLL